MSETSYQLVVQLRSSAREAFDRMVRLEEKLEIALGDLGSLDGHDVGSGEVNLYILTDHPIRAFDLMRAVPEFRDLLPGLRVAYRHLERDEFQVLYPPGQYNFKIT